MIGYRDQVIYFVAVFTQVKFASKIRSIIYGAYLCVKSSVEVVNGVWRQDGHSFLESPPLLRWAVINTDGRADGR